MRLPLFLALPLVSLALAAQAPAPSLGDRVKAERPAVEKLMAELKFKEALVQAEALLPPARPAFDKTNNQTLVQSCGVFLDLAEANRLAAEAADSAGVWEKALDFAKAARSLAVECQAGLKEPFEKTVAYYKMAATRAQQVLDENDARIKELKGKPSLDAGDRQELDLALSVEKEVTDGTKWSKFFQVYLDVTKREATAYDPLVKVMEEKLKSETDQVAAYIPGGGVIAKWVEAVVSTPAYLEAQGDKAGQGRWLHRLALLDPENKKVQLQLDILYGRAVAKPVKKGKKG
ncbi:MAG: hypothetical protein NTW40_13200 [Acidobacteria bacterium]|nr:hypothetical protein [Acidobacteriota bacterium]